MTATLNRRRLLGASAAGAAALALAACGTTEDTAATTDEVAASDAGGEAATGTRTVTDATGAEVEVPADPQRVVVLHYAGAQAMLDLGVTPVGTADVQGEAYTSPEIWSVIEPLPKIDAGDGVPIAEKVAELAPDLILATNALEEGVIAQMQQIAPTYQFLLRGGERREWWTRVEQIADALNVTDAYADLQAAWEQELAEAAAKYQDAAADLTVAVFDVYDEGNLYVWGEENMVGTILQPLGVTWSAQATAALEGAEEPETTVAVEQTLDVMSDATLLFHGSNMQSEASELCAAYMESALFQQLPAAQSGAVFPFGKCTIAGYTDARYSLGQVTAALDAQLG